MSLKFLINHAGDVASSLAMVSGTTASGNIYDLISGPRSSMWRSAASASAIQPGYSFAADLVCTHMVAVRGDLMVTQAGAQVRAMQKSSGGAWSAVSGTTIATLSTSNLIGPTSQDLVIDLSAATNYRGFGLEFDSAGTEAMMLSKLYACIAFDCDETPDPGSVSMIDIPDSGRMFTPMRGTFAYETEKSISFSLGPISRTFAEAFKALPQILRWPFFLYDTAGDIWPWKLEHVIMESWDEIILEQDKHVFSFTMRRLKHYQ